MLSAIAAAVLVAFTLAIALYIAAWSASQMAMGPIAAAFVWRHQRRYTRRARAMVDHLRSTPLVSVIVPACNERLTIVESVRALLALEYDPREIVVVNDGSSDGTLAALHAAFELVPAPLAFARPLSAAPVRAVYRSIAQPGLVVVDKENGGCKADAVNAGINAASGELVLIVDADTVLEPDSLSRAALPFLEDPTVVAVGGTIGIINGCRVEAGRIVEVALPRSWLGRFQIVEYMRAFLLFRLACASVNAVLLISGAFGLFRRDAIIAIGGYDRTAVGEDIDLTIRLQHHFRSRGEPIRIAFDPNPLGWTQAPEDWRSLRAQRYRWRRGLVQALWRHRRIIGNPRFGAVSLAALPYLLIFEGLEPLVEIGGCAIAVAAIALGVLGWEYLHLIVIASVMFGAAVSLTAVLLSDIATRRYMGGRDLVLLVAAAALESCGYRQLNSWWGCVGTAQALRGKSGWGAMKRRVFDT